MPIIGQDRGQPSLSSKVYLTIDLEDINDNAPQFQQTSYDFWIEENSPSGTIVGTILTIDPDLNENAQIKFKIFGGSDAKYFEIEESENESGVVRIHSREEFDYESSINKFFLELQATRSFILI